jgi:DNA-directed RNA polymerase specialized sigma subunit
VWAEFEKAAAGEKERKELRASDLDLWQKWQDSGQHPDHLRPLFQNFRGLIRQKANRWANNVEMPPAAIHAEFNKQFVKALQSYDPNKGAALGTWVSTNLQKAQRWVTTHQNTARIPENRVYKIGMFETARNQLDDQLGRDPTHQELADHLGWTEREVVHMATQVRKANISSAWEHDPTEILPSREAEVLKLIKFELSPEERLVYEHTVGEGGRQTLRPSEIATRLGYSPSKVTRLRQSIDQKIKKYM